MVLQTKERYSRAEVATIIETVLTTLKRDSAAEKKLHDALGALADYIRETRSELTRLHQMDGSGDMPAAVDELDAVISETAKATSAIMDAGDKIATTAQGTDVKIRNELTACVTEIYEACGFQDITGQRITKALRAFKDVEGRIDSILRAFGHTGDLQTQVSPGKDPLLNGPQIGGPAVSQAEIDKLLASFDEK